VRLPFEAATSHSQHQLASQRRATARPLGDDGVEPLDRGAITIVQLGQQNGGERGAILVLAGFDGQAGDLRGQIGRKIIGNTVDVDADAEDGGVFLHLREDAREFFAANHHIVGPFDARLQRSAATNGAHNSHAGSHGESRKGDRRQTGTKQDGEPQSFAARGDPDPTVPTAPVGLGFGEDDESFVRAGGGELRDHIVGGGGLLEDEDFTADELCGKTRFDVVGGEAVGRAQQPVAVMRMRLDAVAERFQLGHGAARVASQRGAGNEAGAGMVKFFEDGPAGHGGLTVAEPGGN